MSADLYSRWIPDVFDEPELFPPLPHMFVGFPLAAIAWLPLTDTTEPMHEVVLRKFAPVALKQVKDSQLYLLVGYASGVEDSVNPMPALWKNADGDSPVGRELAHATVRYSDGDRLFGAMHLGLGLSSKAMLTMRADWFSHLVVMHPRHESILTDLVVEGWHVPEGTKGYYAPSIEVLKRVCGVGGLVFTTAGEWYDDPAGMAVYGRSETLLPLFSLFQ